MLIDGAVFVDPIAEFVNSKGKIAGALNRELVMKNL